MHPQRRTLVGLILLGGPLVLGSYALGAVAWPDAMSKMWGGVPTWLRPLYTGSMFVAAAGFFAYSRLLVLHPQPDQVRLPGGRGYRSLISAYALVLLPSALWLPATKWYLDQPTALRFGVVWLDLAAVAVGSAAIIAATVGLRPRPSRARRNLAIAGALAFGFQTIVLDGLLWPLLTLLDR